MALGFSQVTSVASGSGAFSRVHPSSKSSRFSSSKRPVALVAAPRPRLSSTGRIRSAIASGRWRGSTGRERIRIAFMGVFRNVTSGTNHEQEIISPVRDVKTTWLRGLPTSRTRLNAIHPGCECEPRPTSMRRAPGRRPQGHAVCPARGWPSPKGRSRRSSATRKMAVVVPKRNEPVHLWVVTGEARLEPGAGAAGRRGGGLAPRKSRLSPVATAIVAPDQGYGLQSKSKQLTANLSYRPTKSISRTFGTATAFVFVFSPTGTAIPFVHHVTNAFTKTGLR